MASIVKRKSKYSVVYDYTDENGKRRQRWETFSTNAEAKKRKKQIEYEQDSGTFFIPTAKTLNDLLDEYMSIYGVNTWAMSTYESRRGLARNYITPIIGDMLLSDITPRMMDKYYRDLLSVKTVSVNNRKPTSEYLTPHTVREIHKLLRSAFNQAVRWELISRNPVLNATLPKEEHKERDIWTAETLSKAMEVCDDPILSLALNLAFSCSLRIGEMLGLTWDCIDIAPQSIENGSAYIFVNKELQRVTRGALDDLSDKGVIKKFPPCIASTHTALVLKEPKTKTSIRRVYLPKTVAYMLVERKKEIDELMDLFGDEYIDNNLVFCSSNGRPMESQVINRAFNKLIKENGLPHVVFHSLRHSSITYKLKLNGGDMKSVQGDSGHAQVKMVADVYSHIIDEDRCINAQRLEEAFYSSKTPDPVEDTEPKTADTAVTESDAAKILELLKNPETAALLKHCLLYTSLEALAELYPTCEAFYFQNCGKLLLAEDVCSHQIEGADRFIRFGVNVRFFNIQGTEDMLIDTVGMSTLFLPDLQYHFHGMDPNWVVNHAYNAASYILANDNPIKDGETIDGIADGQMSREIQWKCRYEDALIQPPRGVVDIHMGEYASGKR